jgi:hypothetical protein
MDHDEPDIADLFAPIEPSRAFGVVLSEAQQVLPHVREPVDAELWGSDMIGALSASAADTDDVMTELAVSLVPAAEQAATPEALALLRIFAAIGSPGLRTSSAQAAERVIERGVPDPDWAAMIGAPAVGECWHYSDVAGRQESVTMSFGYGSSEHALSVLIDHGRGGGIKDAWVGDAAGLLDKTWLAVQNDPTMVFEAIDAADARGRLERAISAGECPEKPDEADDLTAHRALLHARMRFLATRAADEEAQASRTAGEEAQAARAAGEEAEAARAADEEPEAVQASDEEPEAAQAEEAE